MASVLCGSSVILKDVPQVHLPEMHYRWKDGMWEVLCDKSGGIKKNPQWELIFLGPGMTIMDWLEQQRAKGDYVYVQDKHR